MVAIAEIASFKILIVRTSLQDVADVCIGTSVGTITEPDCLGPCEPGTSVTLEGIVWHETEGGMWCLCHKRASKMVVFQAF